jgi:hypothetical protein
MTSGCRQKVRATNARIDECRDLRASLVAGVRSFLVSLQSSDLAMQPVTWQGIRRRCAWFSIDVVLYLHNSHRPGLQVTQYCICWNALHWLSRSAVTVLTN